MRYAILTILILAGLGAVARTCGWINETADVAQEQVGARALLKKYEWFNAAAAELDAKAANLKASEAKLASLGKSYEGVARSKWSREDREQYNLWSSEVAGLTANYNGLAAEYNAAMAKTNWRFTNVGDLPSGADRVLPREFRNYQTGGTP